MAVQKQDDQHEHTFSSYVRIRDVVLKTYLGRWTIGRSGERGSGISVLPAIWWWWCTDCQSRRGKLTNPIPSRPHTSLRSLLILAGHFGILGVAFQLSLDSMRLEKPPELRSCARFVDKEFILIERLLYSVIEVIFIGKDNCISILNDKPVKTIGLLHIFTGDESFFICLFS